MKGLGCVLERAWVAGSLKRVTMTVDWYVGWLRRRRREEVTKEETRRRVGLAWMERGAEQPQPGLGRIEVSGVGSGSAVESESRTTDPPKEGRGACVRGLRVVDHELSVDEW